MKINLLVAPYRDSYFYEKFGPAVRDLQILDVLSQLELVEEVTVLNRPVSVFERLLGRKFFSKKIAKDKIKTYDKTSGDLLGAIKGRSWAEDVYYTVINEHLKRCKSENSINIFLDFLPIGKFDEKNLDGWVYWYDFIDNFKKHNRFSTKEKELVESKYSFVRRNANFVTAVSDACLEGNAPYSSDQKRVITNKVFVPSCESYFTEAKVRPSYDFGFLGFVTDKFDIKFIETLARHYTIAIYGQVLDKSIGRELGKIKNVTVHGKFSYVQISQICRTFKVGLLPYLTEKSHDGSPLKLYEYMKYNIPCLTSMDYEISNVFYIRNYRQTKNLHQDISYLMGLFGDSRISESIKENLTLKYCIRNVIETIESQYS